MTTAPQNRMKDFRTKAKLTQRALAVMCGVSQPTIQRAEAEDEAPNYMLAATIADALAQPLDKVFPAYKMRKNPSQDQLSEAADAICAHTVKVRMRGIAEPFFLAVSSGESKRLYGAFQARNGFVVCGSGPHTYAINLEEVQFTHFLFDLPMGFSEGDDDEDEDDVGVAVWFKGCAEPEEFSADADPFVEDPEDEFESDGDLRHMLFMLDMAGGDYGEPADPMRFTDIDGEDVWLNCDQIAVLRIDRSLHDSALMRAEMEGYAEEAAEARATPAPI